MKKLLFLYLALALSNSIFAQCDNPAVILTPQIIHASCPGNGQITVVGMGVVQPNTNFEYALFKGAIEIYTWQTSNVFPNLQAGVYEIRVRRICVASPNVSALVRTRAATVNNTEIPTSISSVTVLRNSRCNNGEIKTLALGSGPLEYSLVPSLTEVEPVAAYVRPRQPTGRFSNLPAGNYFMRVYNACNNAATIPFTIEQDVYNTRVESIPGSFIPIGCDSMIFGFQVVDYFKNTVNFPGDSIAKAWVKWPSGNVDTLSVPNLSLSLTPHFKILRQKAHISELDPAYNPNDVWPHNLNNPTYPIIFGYRDVCGVLHVDTFNYVKPPIVNILVNRQDRSSLTDCDNMAYNFAIYHTGTTPGITKTIQGFNANSGYTYSLDGGATWTNLTTRTTMSTNTGDAYTTLMVFPRGSTNTIMIKYCDTIIQSTFTVAATSPLTSVLYTDTEACLNRGRILIRNYNATGPQLGVRVLSVPPGQPNIPFFITPYQAGAYTYPPQLSNVMAGTYVIEIMDTIGKLCDFRTTVSVTVVPYEFDFAVNVTCNKNLEITSSIPLGPLTTNFRVKIYNNLGAQVLGGPDGISGNTTSYLNIPATDLVTLPDGTYTVRLGRRLGNSLDACSFIEKTWVKSSSNNLSLQNSVFLGGCSDGFGAINASASGGSTPYTFTLFDAGNTIIPPSSPGATNYNQLNTANTYRLNLIDACGSIVSRLMTSNSNNTVVVPSHSTMPCLNENISLTLPNYSGVNYQWFKDGVLLPSATTSTLHLPNLQSSDSALYTTVMTIGNCIIPGGLLINPNDCAGPLAVQLTSFNAYCDPSGANVLNWKTASELNALEFELQKSADLVNWQTVDMVAAHGNSNIENSYSTLDRKPFDAVTYYRLIQRDFNGAERKYAPISNNCEPANNTQFNLYPNPSNSDFSIRYQSERNTTADIRMMDVNGRIICIKSYQLEIGSNTLFVSENLVKGVYLVQIIVDNKELNPIKLVVN